MIAKLFLIEKDAGGRGAGGRRGGRRRSPNPGGRNWQAAAVVSSLEAWRRGGWGGGVLLFQGLVSHLCGTSRPQERRR
ncbi:unnamed protein product [Spirodela intermedia]|uniref:Uncharacterized protein n=1 Tax=Spirodela intermedia TaxID=51605 RepID=A0A7I8IIM8_SPIIN|nr:unnamed protein product [Spirodela intermedia]CAA6657736.1 unnamed protein product [Spirodela intermedia]